MRNKLKTKARRQRDLDDLIGNCGPLDSLFTITLFPSVKANRMRTESTNLRELAEKIVATKADKKENLPLFKGAIFGRKRTDAGSVRSDKNLVSFGCVEIDYDRGKISPEEAAAQLREEGVAGLVYSTPSSTDDNPRWRAVCPLSRVYEPGEHTKFIERLNALFNGEIDQKASFILSQTYYYGSVRGSNPVTTILVDGDYLDDCDHLPRLSRDKGVDDRKFKDESGSAVLFRIACDHKNTGGMGFDSYKQAALDNSAASQHLDRQSNPVRALRRAWDRAPDLRDEFDDLPPLPAQHSRLTFLTPSECENSLRREYVVKGILANGDIGCIFGAPGAGKSLLAPFLGFMIARGDLAFNMRTKQGKVLYVAAEDEQGMRQRIQALRDRYGDANDFLLVGGVSDLLSSTSHDRRDLITAVKERKPTLIIIDTLAMAFPGLEENTAEHMGRVVDFARKLTNQAAAVLLIHHDTKAGGATPRGHSLLNGALDMALHVNRSENGVVRGKLTKNRNGSCERDIAFRIGVETLGTDEDGDPITAAHVTELSSNAVFENLSSDEQLALDLLKAAGEPWTTKQWQDACIEVPEFIQSTKIDSAKRKFRNVKSGLILKEKVVELEGKYVLNSIKDIGEFEL